MSELTSAQSVATPTTKSLYVTAGWGGIGAFAAWLLQPLLVLIISPGRAEREFPVWETIESYPSDGLFEVVVFAGIGIAMLFLSSADTARSTPWPCSPSWRSSSTTASSRRTPAPTPAPCEG